ncbi:MAG: manganese efflux pump [Deltaproteobacteria bacterium]|nr:manganese efflux pump [Deltaproteobacteria bacterium]
MQLRNVVSTFDHWIAFILLVCVGAKMIYEAYYGDDEGCACQGSCPDISWPMLITLSVATSVDALVIGFSFSSLPVTVITPVLVIGLITFVFSFLSAFLGRSCCSLLDKKAEYFGGVVLSGRF